MTLATFNDKIRFVFSIFGFCLIVLHLASLGIGGDFVSLTKLWYLFTFGLAIAYLATQTAVLISPVPVDAVYPRAGYVYLLRAVNGLYKIGHTRNPSNRLRTFSVKLPFDVAYEHLIKCDDRLAAEKALHIRFASKRINGEWFRLDTQDVSYIKSIEKM